MKIIVLLLLLSSTPVFAFGGHGGGSRHTPYNGGVDALGAHYGGDGEIDIQFGCDDPNAEVDIHGTCSCKDGFILNEEGVCVSNKCVGFESSECLKCNPVTGEKTYETLCHNNEYYCNNTHECVNPCDGAYNEECQTCTPEGTHANIQNKTGACGMDDNHVCHEGSCVSIELYQCTMSCESPNNCLPNGEE